VERACLRRLRKLCAAAVRDVACGDGDAFEQRDDLILEPALVAALGEVLLLQRHARLVDPAEAVEEELGPFGCEAELVEATAEELLPGKTEQRRGAGVDVDDSEEDIAFARFRLQHEERVEAALDCRAEAHLARPALFLLRAAIGDVAPDGVEEPVLVHERRRPLDPAGAAVVRA
jgi:hypothetical protein